MVRKKGLDPLVMIIFCALLPNWLASASTAFCDSQSLRSILDNSQKLANHGPNSHTSSIQIPLGNYHIDNYIVRSTSLKLNGDFPTISRSMINSNELEETGTVPLLVADNSTISMSQLVFDCSSTGSAIATVESSTIFASFSRFISNHQTSPFVVTSGAGTLGSTISLIACSHTAPNTALLLPFVSTTAQQSSTPHDTSASEAPSSSEMSPLFLSVCGCDLTLEDTNLVVGTGPLLDFGASRSEVSQNEASDVGAVKTTLAGSVLSNLTTTHSNAHKLCLPSTLQQNLLGNAVTRSTHHLSGTSCLDVNVFGSLDCRNSSFSHCHSNLEPNSTFPTLVLQHYSTSGRKALKDTTTKKISYTRCTFKDMTSSDLDYGASLSLNVSADITIAECSFKANTASTAAAIFVDGESSNPPTLTLTVSLTSFVACEEKDTGVVYAYKCHSVTVTESYFFQNTATNTTAEGGALALTKVSLVSIDGCAFQECTVGSGSSRAGAIYFVDCPSLTLSSSQFRGCTADYGNDVYFYQSGTVDQLKTQVKNCYTDNTEDSMYI
ncbi:hypothetical protein BLNAU_18842 [Blattamonas nauphoetae]|uniref:Right handed beta helix domain-containing protein n=1 Tax=Blattamonas nauphoetae TaxID=2049346 RepID=A0ABQ9X7A8_9EUKA|nr:hypothetical protein BLNAU_18842 [Blattamonas nauphoetae]